MINCFSRTLYVHGQWVIYSKFFGNFEVGIS